MKYRILTYIVFAALTFMLLFLDEWGAAVSTAAIMVLISAVDGLAVQLSRTPTPGAGRTATPSAAPVQGEIRSVPNAGRDLHNPPVRDHE